MENTKNARKPSDLLEILGSTGLKASNPILARVTLSNGMRDILISDITIAPDGSLLLILFPTPNL